MLTKDTPIAIDSTSLRIPLDAGVQIHAAALKEGKQVTYLADNATGEMLFLNEKPNSRRAVGHNADGIDDGVTVTYSIAKVKHDKDTGHIDCLLVGVSSKILGADYFTGIVPATLPQVYSGLMEQGIVSYDYEAMLKHGKMTDIDLKQDHCMGEAEWMHTLKQYKALTHLTRKKDRGYLPFGSQGIQWGHRRGATPANPHVKIYNKTLDLNTQSSKFKAAYLQHADTRNMVRAEATAKDSTMLKAYGYNKGNSVEGIMQMTQQDKYSLLSGMFQKHIETSIVKPLVTEATPKVISMQERFMIEAIEAKKQQGLSMDMAVNYFLAYCDKKQDRYYWKKKIAEVYSKYTQSRWNSLAKKMEFDNEAMHPN